MAAADHLGSVHLAMDAQRAFMDRFGDSLDQLLNLGSCLAFTQESDESSGYWVQVSVCIGDLFNVYRTVLLRKPDSVPVALPPSSPCPGGDLKLRHLQLSYVVVSFALRALRSLQILVEMKMVRSHSLQRALPACLLVEVAKLFLKLLLRSRMPFAFYIDEDALEEIEPSRGNAGGTGGLVAGSNESAVSSFVGRRSGRQLPGLGTAADAPRVIRFDNLYSARSPPSPALLAAEVLFHGRPLLHLLMLMRRGRTSWSAWLWSVVLDRLSVMLLASQVPLQATTKAASLEQAELRRRQALIWWAFVRSPFFEKVLRWPVSVLERIIASVPLVNRLGIMEIMLSLRPYYFTTSAT
eukprot:TRINITY_DN74895_c0_g1_i1.p1 TRINITY_DN74895_c0_g1~~TRINITY_DN74895_c0_g1_i1.p1  ORF type:complete len:353 (+),score=58.00 TRINITY_DN74895_c0_g1_i1:60-1118(+)